MSKMKKSFCWTNCSNINSYNGSASHKSELWFEMGSRHEELEISNFSFYLLKIQTEQRMGSLVGEMTNKETIRVIEKYFLLFFDLERHASEDYVKFKGWHIKRITSVQVLKPKKREKGQNKQTFIVRRDWTLNRLIPVFYYWGNWGQESFFMTSPRLWLLRNHIFKLQNLQPGN